MLRSEAIADIQRTLGYRSDKHDEIVLTLKKAQNQLETGLTPPWFLEEEEPLATVGGQPRVALPDDFWVERDPGPHIGGSFLIKRGEREAILAHGKSSGSQPSIYTLQPAHLKLYPIPDAAYTITFPYYKHDTVLDTDIENGWLKHAPLVLIGSAGVLLAADLRNATAMAKFSEQLQTGQELMYRQQGQHETANYRVVMGRKG